MLVTETRIINNKTYIYTTSDAGYYIRQKDTDILYIDAYDLLSRPHEYEETDEKIDYGEEGEKESET